MRVLAFLWPLVLSAANARADAASIGVYADSLGTRPCVSIEANTPTTLYVVATLEGPFGPGIRGAEFRFEVAQPEGWFVMYTPPSGAIRVGNPVDTDGDACRGAGVTLAFPECRGPDVAPNRVALGTLVVTRVGGKPTHLLVKRHITPGNANFSCPLLIECNDPRNDKHCVQPVLRDDCGNADVLQTGPPGFDAAYFVTAWNTPIDAPSYRAAPRYAERELVVLCRDDALRLPPGGSDVVALEIAEVASAELREAFESTRVAEIGAAFPACTPCASQVEAAYCRSMASFALLRFNHARTAGKAIDALRDLDDVVFVAPAADFVVPHETPFLVTTDIREGGAMTSASVFNVSTSKPARLQVELLDVSGRVRASLHDGLVSSGEHAIAAGGFADVAGTGANGLFKLRVRAGGQEKEYKVVLAGD